MTMNPNPHIYDQIPPLDLLGMAKVVWYGKWVIGAVTACFIGAGTYYAFEMTRPLYAATATLQMTAQVPNQPRNTDPAGLNTSVSHATSDVILGQVIAQLDLLEDSEFNRYLIAPTGLSLASVRASVRDYLSGAESPEPQANYIVHKTIENLRSRLTATRTADTYLLEITARSPDAEKAMRLANVTATAFVADQIRMHQDATLETITWLTRRADSLQAQAIREDRAIIDLIQTVQVHEDTALDRLSNAVLILDEERAVLATSLARFSGIGALSARQQAEKQQIQRRLDDADNRRDRLQGQLASQSSGMLALQQMQRAADSTRALHLSFEARLQEANIQRALAQPDSRLVAPAATVRFVGVRKTLVVTIAAVIGGLAGLLIVALQHALRTGAFHPAQLAKQTGVRVLGQLPASLSRSGGKKNALLLRKIRAALMLQSGGRCPQVIMVTASGRHEASALIAIKLASDLAAHEGQTLLVVADQGNRKIQHILSKPKGQYQTTPHHTATLGCDVSYIADDQALLANGFTAQLAAYKSTYKHIVILVPPAIGAPETLLCARFADAVVYAVRWAKTPIQTVQIGLGLLTKGCNIPIGLVLTKTKPRKMRRFAAISSIPAAYLETRT